MTKVVHGSILNLDDIPLAFQSTTALHLFLASHLPRAPRASTDCSRLIQIIQNIMNVKRPPAPLAVDNDIAGHMH
jgi:hypothetical protein